MLESETGNPPLGAALLIVTVPVELLPPATAFGLTESPAREGAFTVRAADKEEPPNVAVIFASTCVETASVEILNVVDVWPAGIDTVEGVVTSDWLLARLMGSPPAGAAELIVTVPVAFAPPVTEPALNDSPVKVGAFTVRVAVRVVVERFAETVATT